MAERRWRAHLGATAEADFATSSNGPPRILALDNLEPIGTPSFRRLASLPTVPTLRVPGPGTRSCLAFARRGRRWRCTGLHRTARLKSRASSTTEWILSATPALPPTRAPNRSAASDQPVVTRLPRRLSEQAGRVSKSRVGGGRETWRTRYWLRSIDSFLSLGNNGAAFLTERHMPARSAEL
jgi:hypothetical protein